MRMWWVNPRLMCRRHLLGEHVEMHMFVGHIKLGRDLYGFVRKGLVDTSKIKSRHDALAKEMERRGYAHRSPLDYEDELKQGRVDRVASAAELLRRCPECRSLVEGKANA